MADGVSFESRDADRHDVPLCAVRLRLFQSLVLPDQLGNDAADFLYRADPVQQDRADVHGYDLIFIYGL